MTARSIFQKMKLLKEGPTLEEIRIELIDEVRQGKISPKEAEEKAAKQGWGKFSSYANPSDFRVMEEDAWSLDMALAWIIWRVPEKVVEYWPCYRAMCWAWKSVLLPGAILPKPKFAKSNTGSDKERADPISGYKLVQLPQHSIFSEFGPPHVLIFDKQYMPEAQKKLDQATAKRVLRSALIDSQLAASATDCSTGRTVEISSREWVRLQFGAAESTEWLNPLAGVDELEELEPIYRDVFVLRKDILRLWPESQVGFEEIHIDEPPVFRVSEKEYRRWLDTLPKTLQIVGRFFWDVWELDVKPIEDERRYRLVEDYARQVIGGTPPSLRTISRFFEEVVPWLDGRRR